MQLLHLMRKTLVAIVTSDEKDVSCKVLIYANYGVSCIVTLDNKDVIVVINIIIVTLIRTLIVMSPLVTMTLVASVT